MNRVFCILLLCWPAYATAEGHISTQKPESHFSEGTFFGGLDPSHPLEAAKPDVSPAEPAKPEAKPAEPEQPVATRPKLFDSPASEDQVITIDDVKNNNVDTRARSSVSAPVIKRPVYVEPVMSEEEKRARKLAKLQAQKAAAEFKRQRDLTNAETEKLKAEQGKALEDSSRYKGW